MRPAPPSQAFPAVLRAGGPRGLAQFWSPATIGLRAHDSPPPSIDGLLLPKSIPCFPRLDHDSFPLDLVFPTSSRFPPPSFPKRPFLRGSPLKKNIFLPLQLKVLERNDFPPLPQQLLPFFLASTEAFRAKTAVRGPLCLRGSKTPPDEQRLMTPPNLSFPPLCC